MTDGKDESGERKEKRRELEEYRELVGRREHDEGSLTLYLSVNAQWFSMYIRFKDGFTLHTLMKMGMWPRTLGCVVCQHVH